WLPSPRCTERCRSRRSTSTCAAGSLRTFPSEWHSKASRQPTWHIRTGIFNRTLTAAGRPAMTRAAEPLHRTHHDAWLARQHSVKLIPRADAQLGEDLVEVVLDGARADEQ